MGAGKNLELLVLVQFAFLLMILALLHSVPVLNSFRSLGLVLFCKAAITIAIRLRFGFDSSMTKNEHVHFFVALRGIVANKKAGSGRDV